MTEERILDFLDGNLGASEEEELLHRLAVSPERRNLLKQHLQMRELTATLARRQYVTVPKMVTASLFTALASNGYAGPHMPSTVDQRESLVASLERNLDTAADNIVATKRIPLFRRLSGVALASLVSFIAGAAIVYMLMPNASQDKFAASASNVLQGTGNTATGATPAFQSTMVSIPEQQSPIAARTDVNLGLVRNHSQVNARHSDLVREMKLQDVPVASLIGNNEREASAVPILTEVNLPAISSVESKNPAFNASIEDVHGTTMTAKNPFDHVSAYEGSDRSFWQRVTLSFRAGEGKAPGNAQALTGSLIEVRASADITDWFTAKLSVGQFMPYETQAVSAQPGFNSDGVRLLQLSPVLQYRYIVGAELGAKFQMFDAPFEFTGGFISDMKGSIVPRFGFFTTLSLQDYLSLNIGLEGMIYSHDIRSSLRNAQNSFAGEHPSLIGSMQEKESTGFIGPAIEMVWHF